MANDLLQDFWTYCQCYEITRNQALWSALGLLGAVINRKVYIMHGDLKFHCNNYICLVSEAGTGKSTSADLAAKLCRRVFPEYPIGPSQQSREAIVEFMSKNDDCKNNYVNEKGQSQELRVYLFFINELKNFVSYNPAGMVSFLTDIYDRSYFDAGTIKRGLETIPNPAINILACETSEWLINNFRQSIMSGGIGRRMLFVNEVELPPIVPRPHITPAAKAAIERVDAHLHKLRALVGEMKWDPKTYDLWDKWYADNKNNLPDNPIMRGYKRTKHVHVLKVCMQLAAASYEPKLILTPDLFQEVLAMFESIEEHMPKLFIASGRSEFARPKQQIFDMLERTCPMEEHTIRTALDTDVSPMEQVCLLRHLVETKQLIKNTPNGKTLYYLPSVYEELVKKLPKEVAKK
jgi:hypothetical protein